MASRSSSDHPESSHPYHADRSHSTTSLESQGKKQSGGLLSQLLPKSQREGLLPLPEGVSLSSSSPPQLLLLTPLQSIDLPHPANMATTETTVGDLTWAMMYESPPLPPMTILGMPILQHRQPQSAQASSGITLPSHLAPTSQHPATVHLSTEHLPPPQPISSIEELCQSGISPYQPMSTHSSLYRQSRNPSPVAQLSQNPTTAAIGQMPSSSVHPHVNPEYTESAGDESTNSSDQSHNLHLSYSCPLSRDTMSISLMRPAEKAPSRNSPDLTRRSQTSPMKEQIPSRPQSCRNRRLTPTLPVMTLPDAIRFYQRTATDLSIAIPEELR